MVLQQGIEQFAPLGVAVFRIIVGGVFVSHAIPKLQDPESTRQFFGQVGFSGNMYEVYLALGIEIVAGSLLAIGLFTHLAALALTLFMGVATYVAIEKMDKEFEGGYEVDLLLLAACFMFYLMGAGIYSLDHLLYGV